MTVPPAAVAAPLLQFDSVAFQTPAGRRLLDGASFSVARGEFAVLAGPSGAGKSTVLRMCAALTRPQEGRVLVGGTDVVQLKRALVPALRRQIGLVEQDPQWIDGFDVLHNIMLPLVLAGEPRRSCRDRAHAALVRVGLPGRGHSRIDELSGGEQQRAALARAIVHRPALLLVDEPTAHLDDEAALGVCELLTHFSTGGTTVLMATHGESIALPTSVRRLRLAGGRIA